MKYLGSISDNKDLVNKEYVDNLIAPTYTSISAYDVGECVIYNNKLYKCNTAIPSPGEAWTSAHWTEVKMANVMDDDVSNLKSTLDTTWEAEYDKVLLTPTQETPAYIKEDGTLNTNTNWMLQFFDISDVEGVQVYTKMSAIAVGAQSKRPFGFYKEFATRTSSYFTPSVFVDGADAMVGTPATTVQEYAANLLDAETIIVCSAYNERNEVKVYGYKKKSDNEDTLVYKYTHYGTKVYNAGGIGTLVGDYIAGTITDTNSVYILQSQTQLNRIAYYDGYRFRLSTKFPLFDDIKNAFNPVFNAQRMIYEQFYPSDSIFTSGTINISGDSSIGTNRIRIKGSVAPIMYKEDYIVIDSAYEARLFGFNSRTYSSANLLYADPVWRSGTIHIPAVIDGKYISLAIRKVGHESEDISADVSILHRYVKFYHDGSYDAYERNKDKEPLLAAVSRLRYNGLNKQDFELLMLTDDHGDYISVKNAVTVGEGFSTIDAIIHLGDIVASAPENFNLLHQDILFSGNKPTYYVVGNHDVGNSKAVDSTLTTAEAFSRYTQPIIDKGYLESGEYENGKPYYYHDFADRKIRLIVVYEYDAPDDLANESTYKITRGDSVIQQEQAEWFFTTLNSTPDEYGVIVAMHQPFSFNKIHITSSKFNNPAYTDDSIRRSFSTDMWADAVDAFVNRTTYTCNMVCTGDAAYLNGESGYYYSTSFDFSNAKGKFICFIGGHTHQDSILQHTTYTYMKQVIVVCASTNDYMGGVSSMPSDIRRTSADGLAHDSITVLGATDTAIRLAKVGANVTIKMTPRDYEEISVVT